MKFPLSTIYATYVHMIASAYQRSNDLANCSQLIIISKVLEHHTLFVQTMFSHSPDVYKIPWEKYL